LQSSSRSLTSWIWFPYTNSLDCPQILLQTYMCLQSSWTCIWEVDLCTGIYRPECVNALLARQVSFSQNHRLKGTFEIWVQNEPWYYHLRKAISYVHTQLIFKMFNLYLINCYSMLKNYSSLTLEGNEFRILRMSKPFTRLIRTTY
jgi:hypothetical protein